jgi:hypothetical protein
MVSNLPISSPYRSTPNAPVSDAERERLNVRLNAAYTAGSLDEDDYQSRLNVLFAAQRMGELLPVVEGLPPLQTYNSPPMVASTGGQPGEVSVSRNAGGVSLLAVAGVAALIIVVAILFLVLV